MAKPIIAAVLNFFTLGLGYLIFTKKKVLGLFLFLAFPPSAYVEFSLQTQYPPLYWYSFGAFFLLAIGCAYDGFVEGKAAAAAPAKAA